MSLKNYTFTEDDFYLLSPVSLLPTSDEDNTIMSLKNYTFIEDDYFLLSPVSLLRTSDEDSKDSCTSSVGSNHPVYEVIILSDDEDDDEVESPPTRQES